MSRYLAEPNGELVGYSVWPYDPLYRPIVGVFRHGRLAAHAVCDLERPVVTEVSHGLPARIMRRLGLSKPRSIPTPLEGPPTRCWFQMRLDPALAELLKAGDPAVRVIRLADGERLSDSDPGLRPERATSGAWTVERLLDLGGDRLQRRLNGFPALLATRPRRQLDAAYMDLLGRMPDPEAHRNYLPRLESGAWTLLELQHAILTSEEFRNRGIGLEDRVGALMTSELWIRVVEAEGVDPESLAA